MDLFVWCVASGIDWVGNSWRGRRCVRCKGGSVTVNEWIMHLARAAVFEGEQRGLVFSEEWRITFRVSTICRKEDRVFLWQPGVMPDDKINLVWTNLASGQLQEEVTRG